MLTSHAAAGRDIPHRRRTSAVKHFGRFASAADGRRGESVQESATTAWSRWNPRQPIKCGSVFTIRLGPDGLRDTLSPHAHYRACPLRGKPLFVRPKYALGDGLVPPGQLKGSFGKHGARRGRSREWSRTLSRQSNDALPTMRKRPLESGMESRERKTLAPAPAPAQERHASLLPWDSIARHQT